MLLTGCDLYLLQATDLAKLLSAAATRIQNLQNENEESGALDMKSIWYSLTDSKMRTQSLEVSVCVWHPEAFKVLLCIACFSSAALSSYHHSSSPPTAGASQPMP